MNATTVDGTIPLLLATVLAPFAMRRSFQTLVVSTLAVWAAWRVVLELTVLGTEWWLPSHRAADADDLVGALTAAGVAWLVRGVHDHRGGRWLLPIVALVALGTCIGLDLRHSWARDDGDATSNVHTFSDAFFLAALQTVLVLAAVISPYRTRTLVVAAAAYGALTATVGGLRWGVVTEIAYAAPLRALLAVQTALVVGAIRCVRRLDGLGPPPGKEPIGDPDDSDDGGLPWNAPEHEGTV